MTGKDIKEIIRDVVEYRDEYGFEAFLILKSKELKKLTYEDDNPRNEYRIKIRDMMICVLEEKYLPDDIEFKDDSCIADNQNHCYIIPQKGENPLFSFLSTDNSQVNDFSSKDFEETMGIAFRFRGNGNEVWAYQHMWSIMVPNKKKTNVLSCIFSDQGREYLVEQKNTVFTIANRIDALVFNDCVLTSNISLLEKSFSFDRYICEKASQTIAKIADKSLVSDTEKLKQLLESSKTNRIAKKLMRIFNSKVFDVPNETIKKRIRTLPRWKGRFKENEKGELVIETKAHFQNLIDLLDERYTRSEVTGIEYDTDVKSIASADVSDSETQVKN